MTAVSYSLKVWLCRASGNYNSGDAMSPTRGLEMSEEDERSAKLADELGQTDELDSLRKRLEHIKEVSWSQFA